MAFLSIALALLVVLLALVYYYLKRKYNVFKEHGIPYLKPTPFFGNFASLITQQETITKVIQKSYDVNPDARYVGFYEFLTPVVLLRDPELFKSVAIKNHENFPDHRKFSDERTDPLFGGMLFQLTGDHWKEQRNMLSPTFTSSKIKNMFVQMSECAERFTLALSKLSEKEPEVEMRNMLARYTNDVIAKCVYGITVDSMKEPKNMFYVYGRAATLLTGIGNSFKMLMYRNCPELAVALRLRFIKKYLLDFYTELVEENVKTRDETGTQGTDMLQLLMDIRNKKDGSKGMTLDNIICHAFTFFFGGFDTVSSQAAFVAHMLVENPEVQTRLQEEIDEAIEKSDGKLTYDIINELKYLDAVVNETLRLYPIVAFLDRLCTTPFELPPTLPGQKPFVVQRGMNVWLPVHSIHTDPRYYENPHKFDPDRFLNNGKKILNSGIYLPFGIGPRMCIGNRFALTEMKVLLCHLLARCNFKASPKTLIPLQLQKGVINVTAKNNQFWVKIEPRKNIHPKLVEHTMANGVSAKN